MSRYTVAVVVTTAFFNGLLSEVCYAQAPAREWQTQPYVSYPLMYKNAVWAIVKVKASLGDDIDIIVDADMHTVLIRASADKTRKAKEILKRLDVPSCTYIVTLKNADAAKTAKTLMTVVSLLRLLSDDRDVGVGADDRTNSIGIWASSEEKATEIKAILRQLDVKTKE